MLVPVTVDPGAYAVGEAFKTAAFRIKIQAFNKNREQLNGRNLRETEKLYIYVVARIFKILTQVNALHEDLQYDFNALFEQLTEEMYQIPGLMKMLIYQGLDINWMLGNGIPEDIVTIQKNLRQRGYLK